MSRPLGPITRIIVTSLVTILIFAFAAGANQALAQSEVDDAANQPGAPLQIATKEIEPFVFTGDELTGFSIDLWQALAETAELEYEFHVVETVNDQLGAVTSGDADAAIAAISITRVREEVVDFSFSYFPSGLGILVSKSNDWSLFASLLNGSFLLPLLRLFAFLLFVVVVAGHGIWLLERKRNPDFPNSYVAGVWEGIWWAAVTVTTVGYGDKTPRDIFGRLFGLFWMFAGLFILAYFTAGVTTRLTLQHIEGSIDGPEDLPGKVVVTVEGSTSDDWLAEQRIPHRTVEVVDDAYEMLEQGEVQAVVYDYPVLRYYALNFGEGRTHIVGAPFDEEAYGIAFATDSPLREEFNRALLQLREDGTYARIHAQWFGH